MPLYESIGNIVRRIYDMRIEGPPVLDVASNFPSAEGFFSTWQSIRDEARAVAQQVHRVPRFHEIMREQTSISANDKRDWRMFLLKADGAEFPHNMAVCPTLAALVTASPDVLSASISFLTPGKHIPVHRGPFRGVLRFYLVLSMPLAADGRPAAVLKIAGTEHRLADGEYLLWDNTFSLSSSVPRPVEARMVRKARVNREAIMLIRIAVMLLIGTVALATPAAAQSTPPAAAIIRTVIATTKLPSVTDVPLYFRVVSVTLSPSEKSSVSAANGILYQMSGSTEVAVDNQAATLKSGDGVFIPGGRKVTLTAGSGVPSTFLHFILAPATDLDRPVETAPAVARELYRTPTAIPDLKPGGYDLNLTLPPLIPDR